MKINRSNCFCPQMGALYPTLLNCDTKPNRLGPLGTVSDSGIVRPRPTRNSLRYSRGTGVVVLIHEYFKLAQCNTRNTQRTRVEQCITSIRYDWCVYCIRNCGVLRVLCMTWHIYDTVLLSPRIIHYLYQFASRTEVAACLMRGSSKQLSWDLVVRLVLSSRFSISWFIWLLNINSLLTI